MEIDHDLHRARVKEVSNRLNHPMTYNDAGAPSQAQQVTQQQNEEDERKLSRTKEGRADQVKRGARKKGDNKVWK